jgi:hypothetical protein
MMNHEYPPGTAGASDTSEAAKVVFLLWIGLAQAVAVIPVLLVGGLALAGWGLARYLGMMSNDPDGTGREMANQILIAPFQLILIVGVMIGLTGWGSARLWKGGRFGPAALLSSIPAIVVVSWGARLWLRMRGS